MKQKFPQLSGKSLEKLHLFRKLLSGNIDSSEVIRLSFLRGMITKNQYLDYQKTERESKEE